MAAVLPNEGKLYLAAYQHNNKAQGDWVLRTFSNNLTPTVSSVKADFTESTYTGYAAKTLTGASWSEATVSDKARSSYAEQSWNATSSENVYGWYITDPTNTVVLIAQRDDSAPRAVVNGDTVKVTPVYDLA